MKKKKQRFVLAMHLLFSRTVGIKLLIRELAISWFLLSAPSQKCLFQAWCSVLIMEIQQNIAGVWPDSSVTGFCVPKTVPRFLRCVFHHFKKQKTEGCIFPWDLFTIEIQTKKNWTKKDRNTKTEKAQTAKWWFFRKANCTWSACSWKPAPTSTSSKAQIPTKSRRRAVERRSRWLGGCCYHRPGLMDVVSSFDVETVNLCPKFNEVLFFVVSVFLGLFIASCFLFKVFKWNRWNALGTPLQMPDGCTPLFAAASNNKLNVVKYLLAAGCDKDSKQQCRMTSTWKVRETKDEFVWAI